MIKQQIDLASSVTQFNHIQQFFFKDDNKLPANIGAWTGLIITTFITYINKE